MSERRPQTESELADYVRSIDVRAPQELHRKIEALVAESDRAGRRSQWARSPWAHWPSAGSLRFKLGGAAAALAALAAVLVLVLAGGGAPALTLRETSGLTLRAATMTAPAESSVDPKQLAVAVDGVGFPYWEDRFGWRSTGARVDRIGGRAVTTVFYTDGHGRRIGYAIVAGTPAPAVSGGTIAWREGVAYRLTREHGAAVVTWMREGHLCVVSGRDMDSATLLALASWNDGVPT
jgi:hypothetical protein